MVLDMGSEVLQSFEQFADFVLFSITRQIFPTCLANLSAYLMIPNLSANLADDGRTFHICCL